MKIKLPWKLTLVFCLAALAGLLIGYFFLTFQIKGHFEKTFQENLRNQMVLAKDFLEAQGIAKDPAAADRWADVIGRDLGLRATIIASDGTVLGDTELDGEDLRRAENHLNRPEVQEAIRQDFGASKRYSYTIKRYLLYMAVPLGKGGTDGFLRFAVLLSALESLEKKLTAIIAVALFIVFFLSLVLASLASFFISRPLTEMVSAAKAMAQGDFSRKPSIYSQDEIGDLARAFVHMSEEIKKKITTIKQEGAKLDAVLSSMFEGVMVLDEQGKIVLMNPSLRKIFFVDMDPEGRKPLEVVRNAVVQETADRIMERQDNFVSQEIVMPQLGNKTLKVNAVPVVRKNTIEGAVLVFHDITELRRLEQVRQDFVANVSHELRTPIASIKGYAETLLEGALDDKDNARDFVKIIYEDSNRLAVLISDLLDLAKIESGKLEFELLAADLKSIIARCLGVLKKPIQEKSLKITVSLPEALPRVLADEKRLSQVILNLLDNAVKYTPERGEVRILAHGRDNVVQVDVVDTGIGIPAEDIPRIFERFYRVDKARSREMGGTGLGLSIAKHIVLAHGGQVWVESQAGQGSTFSFTIPQA